MRQKEPIERLICIPFTRTMLSYILFCYQICEISFSLSSDRSCWEILASRSDRISSNRKEGCPKAHPSTAVTVLAFFASSIDSNSPAFLVNSLFSSNRCFESGLLSSAICRMEIWKVLESSLSLFQSRLATSCLMLSRLTSCCFSSFIRQWFTAIE